MNIQTVTGPTIQDALAEARATLGDAVVLLESVPAGDGELAKITVALDAAAPRQPAPRALATVGAGGELMAAEAGSGVPALGFGYGTARPATMRAPRPTAVRQPLYAAPTPKAAGPAPEVLDKLDRLGALLDGFADRLDRLEDRLEETGPTGEGRWAVHPLYGALVGSGLTPATAAALLDAAEANGCDPTRTDAEGREALRWAVALALRDRLAPTAPPRHLASALAVVGPGGSGKTSLLVRLATDPRGYGRRAVGVLAVVPEGEEADRTAPFRERGVCACTVTTAAETRRALDRLAGSDVILIDTPALPPDAAGANRMLAWLADVLAPLGAFEVLLTLDAARARPPLDFSRLNTLPLPPTAAAVTRLDEADGWGRPAEWLLALGLPVSLATTGPEADGTLASYSPAWFAEGLVKGLEDRG